MTIVVAFSCAVGGWFCGVVSAYLLYRFGRFDDDDDDDEDEVPELHPVVLEPATLKVVRGDS